MFIEKHLFQPHCYTYTMPKIPLWVFIIVGLLYFTAVRVNTMDVDASQYAEMSREMMSSHNWLMLYDRGLEYLDKPPFLIWISALNMKIFGVSNFGYKLPSILFGLWAIYATYRLAKLICGENTARAAALILATCQGMFLMTNDIRCDTILMSWVITAIWLIKEWDIQKRLPWLMGGFACIGFGMMTKGPIALMVPVFCFATDWALKREWKKFFHWAYLPGIAIIALLLLPMSIGLYQQFDLHPEKIVNGKTGISGLRFYYWSQSFGRITGESPWKNGANISFLLVNMLWSFLPWVFILVPAIIYNIIALFRQKFRLLPGQEWITTGGFLLAYFALGSSAYQLPHYIFVAFPLAAIITAKSVNDFIEGNRYAAMYKVIRPFFNGVILLLLVLVLVLITYVFPSGIFAVLLWAVCMAAWVWLLLNKKLKGKLVLLPAAGMFCVNIFITNFVYYQLLGYQVGSQVGTYMNEAQIPGRSLVVYKMRDPINALNFYYKQMTVTADTIVNVRNKTYILTMDEGLRDLKENNFNYDIIRQGRLFKVSELTPKFLNPATREQALKNYYLVKVKE